jgi:hypothetical protein
MGATTAAGGDHHPALTRINSDNLNVPKQGMCPGTRLAHSPVDVRACSGTTMRPDQLCAYAVQKARRPMTQNRRALRERAVLTLSCVRVALASRHAVLIGAAAILSIVTAATNSNAAYADGVAAGGCVGGGASFNCVVHWGAAGDPYIRTVPQPIDEAERTHAAERDRKWEDRCKPTIAQDRYGVPRYQYSAAGCEFGVIQ